MKANMHEAKTRLSQLADLAAKGEPVVIAKSGKPYVDLVPHRTKPIRQPGHYKNKIKISADFDVTPIEVISGFEGE
jgi:prevent-host-death family protein